jgi:thiomorpholine-carboxylate dehydrogenase
LWFNRRDPFFAPAKVEGEIGEILAGAGAPAVPRDRRIVFKSVGMAVEDLTAARLLWQWRKMLIG